MIIAWLIGLILSFLVIWLLKNSRVSEVRSFGNELIEPERPILKIWSLVLLVIGSLIPIINIIMGIIMFTIWAISVYCEKDWKFTKGNNRLILLLNKPVK